jgi:hypothetical protein
VAIALVQQSPVAQNGNSTSLTITLSRSATAGNVVTVLLTAQFVSSTATTISGLGATWTKVVDSGDTNFSEAIIWAGTVGSSGTQITLSNSASPAWTASAQEWSGLSTTADGTTSNYQSFASTNINATFATNNASDLVLGVATGAVSTPSTPPGSPWIKLNSGGSSSGVDFTPAYQITSQSGTFSPSWTNSSSADMVIALAGLKAGTGGGGGGGGGLLLPIGSFTDDGPVSPLLFDFYRPDDGSQPAWYCGSEWMNFPLVSSWRGSTAIRETTLALAGPASQNIAVKPASLIKGLPKFIASMVAKLAATDAALRAAPKLLASLASIVASGATFKGQPKQTNSGGVTGVPNTAIKAEPKLTDTIMSVLAAAASMKARPTLLLSSTIRVAGSAVAKATSLVVQTSGVVFQSVIATAAMKLTALGSPVGAGVKASSAATTEARPKLLGALSAALKATSSVKGLPGQLSSPMAKLTQAFTLVASPAFKASSAVKLVIASVAKLTELAVVASATVYQTVIASAVIKLTSLKLPASPSIKTTMSLVMVAKPFAQVSSAIKLALTITATAVTRVLVNPVISTVVAGVTKLAKLAVVASETVYQTVVVSAVVKLTSLGLLASPSIKANSSLALMAKSIVNMSSAVKLTLSIAAKAIPRILDNLAISAAATLAAKARPAITVTERVLQTLFANMTAKIASLGSKSAGSVTATGISKGTVYPVQQSVSAGTIAGLSNVQLHPLLGSSVSSIKTVAVNVLKAAPKLATAPLVGISAVTLGLLGRTMLGAYVQQVRNIVYTILKRLFLLQPEIITLKLSANIELTMPLR